MESFSASAVSCDDKPAKPISRERWVAARLDSMSIDQKIGQLMVFAHYGSVITPDVKELVTRYQVGGFRISQKFHPGSSEHRRMLRTIAFGVEDKGSTSGEKLPANAEFLRRSTYGPDRDCYDRPDFSAITCTARDFAGALNNLRRMARDAGNEVGLHFAFDHEGEFGDFCFKTTRNYPNPLGLAASGDPKLAYAVGRAIALQARAIGANFIHSPVVDVALEPDNPEIGSRAFGRTAADVARFALENFRGLRDGGLTCTAKHFPGRGKSTSDAHFGLPVVRASYEEMMSDHLMPYRVLIDAGLPAVMAAFSAYPALEKDGAENIPAATSERIIRGVLREQLGFDGVITTDNCQMGGMLESYEIGDGVVRCLQAGCDLILFRAYTPARIRVIEAVRDALRSGVYSEDQLEASVRRILGMRYDMGLHHEGGMADLDAAAGAFDSPEAISVANDAARRSVAILRDREGLIPIVAGRRVLVVEQAHALHLFQNSDYCHPGILWRKMREVADGIGGIVVSETPTEADQAAVRARLGDADLLVVTNYYNYRGGTPMESFLEELRATGKPIVLIVNNPFPKFGALDWAGSIVWNSAISSAEGNQAAAEVLLGELSPTASF